MKKYITTTLKAFINEQKGYDYDLDLSNFDSIKTWLESYASPENIVDDDGEIDWGYTDPMTGDDLETMIYDYMEQYKDTILKEEIEVYRMVKLNSIKDLDLKKVGVFWSFDESGVGAYGYSLNQKFTGDKPFVLNATIKTKDIGWEQGFYSFIAYGKSQMECYVTKGSKCLITHINEEELDTPIEGIC